MPLIMMCGLPCSGKTRLAHALAEYMAEHTEYSVVLVNDESLDAARADSYRDATQEKNFRAILKAAVERHLSADTLVICDSLNYIKGYRYQLYCLARSLSTPSCVVLCPAAADTVRAWNAAAETPQWPPALLDELVQRFEPPSPTRRWENPTFVASDSGGVDLAAVCAYVRAPSTAGVNIATQQNTISDTNYLHKVDRVTQEMVRALLRGQHDAAASAQPLVLHAGAAPLHVRRVYAAGEAQRLRRTFLDLSRQMSTLSSARDAFEYGSQTDEQIANAFVNYLAALNDS